MNIIGFFGIMGSGKGVSSTRFLRKQRSKFYKRIIANCYLNTEDVTTLSTDELYSKYLNPEYFDNSYLYITELHTILDSRRSSSLMNTNFTMFLTQLGKRDCYIIYDSQLSGQIDVRMREFTPYRIICEKFIYYNGKWVHDSDMFGLPRKTDHKIAILEKLQFENSNGKTIEIPKNMYIPTQEDFNYYHTEEIISIDRSKYLRR